MTTGGLWRRRLVVVVCAWVTTAGLACGVKERVHRGAVGGSGGAETGCGRTGGGRETGGGETVDACGGAGGASGARDAKDASTARDAPGRDAGAGVGGGTGSIDAPTADGRERDGGEGVASSVGRAHCLPVAAAGAMEPALKGPLYIQNIANGQAIDLSGGTIADDQPISEWKPNSSAPQQWWFEKAGSGWHLKSNINGEYCLARRDDDSSAPTLLRKCAATGEWEVLSLGDGQYLLKVPGKELFLNVADETFQEGRALVVSANRGPGAQWSLIDVGFRAGGSAGCDDPTLDEVTFLGTHNAFHSSAYGSKLLPNQTTSVAQQLADGVRGFQLDVYDHDATVWTCHGSCDIDGLRGPPFKDLLQDAVDFLNRNPNEIVTLFLEDHVAKADDLCKVLDAVPGLKALVFDPNQYDVLHKGWPRLSTLRARNHRLLFLSQQSGRESCGVMYDRRFESENYWSLGAITATPDLSCRTRWAGAPLNACGRGGAFRPLHVMNHYRDAMFSLNCAGDNGARLRQRALEICAQAAGRKPNFIVVDCYEVGDAKKVVDELNRCDPNACRCP